jgi:hypothetical protein
MPNNFCSLRFHYCLGTIAPINGNYPDVYSKIPWMPNWLDLNIMVPFIATILTIAVGVLVICVAFNRRRGGSDSGHSKDVYCMLMEPKPKHPVHLYTYTKKPLTAEIIMKLKKLSF